MFQQRYRYTVQIHREDGSCLRRVETAVDWQRALECTWFLGLRREEVDLADGTRSSAILPLWHPEIGEPYVGGFRVTIISEKRSGLTEDFTTAYFRDEARRALMDLVCEGRLEESDTVRLFVTASHDEAHAKAGPASSFTVREEPARIRLIESRFSDVAGIPAGGPRCVPDGRGGGDAVAGAQNAVDFPVVIPRTVLEEARDLVRAARPNESGGILVGRLHRDIESRDVFAEVTAQIPAQYTTSSVDRLTFTPETWAAAGAALERRDRGEIYLGWFHFHRVLDQCASCPDEKRGRCELAKGFLSADDRHLHRVVFPRAYTVALVFSPTAGDGVEHALFGWRYGALEKRGFYVTGDPGARRIPGDAREPHTTRTGGNEHVTESSSEDERRRSDPCGSS